jgi:hypothetical protein
MDRSKRRSNARARGRERSRQMVYLAAIGSVLGVGLFAAGELKVGQFLPWLPRLSLSKPAPVPTEEEIYTASILYLPNEGTTCRQLLFDNRTGRFRDNGLVDCERAYYHGTNESATLWPNARAVVISQGFRGR